ncbi:TetR/AcrR family transcriptional regulator [Plantactinospora sp. GCM10030261]|uniref:TetR/AcrR family transcriptional regulator n=1 Tax=Plantactinospora sp. GCM10030261 TaxID=3273420 RepID=UPI0036187259
MPRKVDYRGRRHQMIDAVCALADEQGVEGVTMRDVAERAGVSLGAVQRCFRDKDEMLTLTMARVSENFSARLRVLTTQPAPAALARVAVDLALLDVDKRPEARVWLAFVARAAVTPNMSRILQEGHRSMVDVLTRLIREIVGATGATVDVEREARSIFALADGLTVQVLLGQIERDEARQILTTYVERLYRHERSPGS